MRASRGRRGWTQVGVVVALVVIVAGARIARAGPGPVRVSVACEGEARTKACPAFLLGFIDAHAVLQSAPRADADVVLYATATPIALVDHLQLRFVGKLAGAPPVIVADAELDTRASDDAQRAQLEPAFLRGVALFVAARDPAWLSVTLAAPDPRATPSRADAGHAWDLALELSGFGNWTRQYQSYSGAANLAVTHLTPRTRIGGTLSAHGGIDREPALTLDDGTVVPLDSSQWQLGANAGAARLYDQRWSYGAGTRVLRDDRNGEYDYSWASKLGVEWDRYRADDPRGNRLAVLYAAGYQVERYRLRNVLGERFASYPIHAVIANGSFRADQLTLGLQLQIGGEMFDPGRRHSVSASPSITWQLGGHVDVRLAFSITKREAPVPDPAEINPTDYAQQSRLSYTEPLSMSGSLGLTIHADRENGARNDRLTDL
ncbi:MAG: hypothetical protein ABIY55_24150 [Kofleriaceae bacterium]